MSEPWLPIPSWPGYHANASGQIRGRRGWVLIGGSDGKGYLQVTLWKGGKSHCKKVHRLICRTFHGPHPAGVSDVAHYDGNRSNNAAANLRWATRADNVADMVRHGTILKRELHPRARLTEAAVAVIRATYAKKTPGQYIERGTRQRLADRFGVGVDIVKDVAYGRSWIDQ